MEGFIETLNAELSQRIADQPVDKNSLMPVIQINSVARSDKRVEGKRRGR